ncbi:MAG: bifunctional DNA-formamidopyrimidine glycosylase/DNA-(apurinic or apyrimidinic site) lyase [Planctomycetota bacterium]
MPELPEVETVCRTLAEAVVDQRVEAVRIARKDVVRGPQTLLRGQRIVRVLRHGKQLAMVGDRDGCVCVHLGMSGSLRVVRSNETRSDELDASPTDHVHVTWNFAHGIELRFRDPRRFGGVWAFADEAELRERRWDKLGPDGLVITPVRLHAGLSRTQRDLKAALLDQHLVAGLGNIYVDELLFATKLHPRKLAAAVTKAESERLVRAMRRILTRAIEAGGSTLRDYVDAQGQSGGFQNRHQVYGRGGEACPACGQPLESFVVAGRTTTACGHCQLGARVSGER